MFNNKIIFIPGGTGSWGHTLTRILLDKFNPKEIIIFSRGELAQVLMSRKFNDPRIRYVIGDIRDYEAVERATRGVDICFYLSALKHVPVCEDNPQEAVKTNVNGTVNIINAAIANKLERVIDVSTDKAVEPNNLYGMTKAVGEKLIIQANDLSEHTRFMVIRAGNVMGSNGSVIPYFIEQIKSGGPLTITNKEMTRFFLTLEEAIYLLFTAIETSIGGEIFVMKMPACKITELAEVIMEHYGVVTVIETGTRPGEKLHEALVSKYEAPLTRVYDDNYYVILPPSGVIEQHYNHLPEFPMKEFDSNTFPMTRDDVRVMLKKGGFLIGEQK